MKPAVFDHFDLQMRFLLQRRALFDHLDFKKRRDTHNFSRNSYQSRHASLIFSSICLAIVPSAASHKSVQTSFDHAHKFSKYCQQVPVTFLPGLVGYCHRGMFAESSMHQAAKQGPDMSRTSPDVHNFLSFRIGEDMQGGQCLT